MNGIWWSQGYRANTRPPVMNQDLLTRERVVIEKLTEDRCPSVWYQDLLRLFKAVPRGSLALSPKNKDEGHLSRSVVDIGDDTLSLQIPAFIGWGHDTQSRRGGRLEQQMGFTLTTLFAPADTLVMTLVIGYFTGDIKLTNCNCISYQGHHAPSVSITAGIFLRLDGGGSLRFSWCRRWHITSESREHKKFRVFYNRG